MIANNDQIKKVDVGGGVTSLVSTPLKYSNLSLGLCKIRSPCGYLSPGSIASGIILK